MRFLLPLLVLLSSCEMMGGKRITGNGHVRTENIKIDDQFDEVQVSGAVKVHLVQNTSNTVRLETDENLIEYIQVRTRGGRLEIKTRDGYQLDPSKEVIAYVSAPVYKRVDVSGACDIIGDGPITGSETLSMEVSGAGNIQLNLSVPKLVASMSGNSSATLKGNATEFEADLSGAGDLKCFELVTQRSQHDLSGACDVEINAEKELVIDASGASSVKYKGNPSIKQQISGAGSVRKAD